MGRACGPFTYFVPFMVVALTGSIIAAVLVFVLKKSGALAAMARMAGNEKTDPILPAEKCRPRQSGRSELHTESRLNP